MNKTENLKLNVWEKSDPILVGDFNENFAAIDDAIHEAVCSAVKIYTGSYTGNGNSGNRTVELPAEPKLMVLIGYYGTPGNFLYQDIDIYCNGRWLAINSTGSGWFENNAKNFPQINGPKLILDGNQHNVVGYEEQYLIIA